ncbi:MAG: 4-hydroxybenzoate octaprenyltransferase [Betaproteobacteria bacterium]|nr:4-hydroxybenzoate octaprenyltransferase [Betaproteobacteria bacterium]
MDIAAFAKRINAYERLMRLDKPAGGLLLLWPTLWAVWIASHGRPMLDIVLIFVTGTFLMRSAGCAINDWADRDFDGRVARTRERPLAAGEITPKEALILAALLAALAFCLVLFLNLLAILLSVAALAIACAYPFAKRLLPLPQLGLSIAFSFGIPMAFAAVRNQLPWECWALFAANACYVFAYDTEYAMVDRDDDLKIGIRSSAITLGRYDVAAVMASYVLMIAILASIGIALRLGWPYYAGLTAAAGMMFSHYTLIRERSREGCWRAFRHNNWVGLAIFAGIAFSALLPVSL